MSVTKAHRLKKYIRILEEANAFIILLVLDDMKESTSYSLGVRLAKETKGEYYLSQGSVDLRLESLCEKGVVEKKRKIRGKRKRVVYSLSNEGKHFVEALRRFLEELEKQP